MNKPVRWILLLAALLPALVPLLLIQKHGVDFPYWDEWDPDIAGIYIKAHDHQLTFGDMVAQHNEHRILFPRIVYLILNPLTRWNAIDEMICQWVIVVLTSLGILWLCRQTQPPISQHASTLPLGLRRRTVFAWFVCNLLIFTPAAWENWTWGIGVENVLPMAFIVATLIVIGSKLRPWTKIIAAIVFAGAASYSSGNGMLAWPLASALLLWPLTRESLSRKKWTLIAWFAAFVVLTALYFVHYQKPQHRGIHPYAHSLSSVLAYIPIFLGSPFAFWGFASPLTTAIVAGVLMLALLVLMLIAFAGFWRNGRDEVCQRMLVWFAVAGFAVLSAAMIASSRAGMGIDHSLSNCRYVTYAIYLPVALVQLLILAADAAQPRLAKIARGTCNAFVGLLIVLVPLTWSDAFEQSRLLAIQRREGKAGLLLIQVLPDNPLIPELVFPDVEPTLRQAKRLNEIGLIRPPLIDSPNALKLQESNPAMPSAQGRMERMSPNGPEHLAASGWAISTIRSTPADMVFLTYEDAQGQPNIFTLADIRLRREDVARQFGNQDYLFSGWLAQFPLSKLPQDLPRITIAAWALNTDTGKAVKLLGTISITPTGQPAPREDHPATSTPR